MFQYTENIVTRLRNTAKTQATMMWHWTGEQMYVTNAIKWNRLWCVRSITWMYCIHYILSREVDTFVQFPYRWFTMWDIKFYMIFTCCRFYYCFIAHTTSAIIVTVVTFVLIAVIIIALWSFIFFCAMQINWIFHITHMSNSNPQPTYEFRNDINSDIIVWIRNMCREMPWQLFFVEFFIVLFSHPSFILSSFTRFVL